MNGYAVRTDNTIAQHASLPRLLLLLLFLVGFHTRLTLYSDGQVLVPLYLCLIPATFFTIVYFQRITMLIIRVFVFILFFIILYSIITYLTTNVIHAQIQGGLQLFSSLILGLGLYFVLDSTHRSVLRRGGLFLWVIIVLVGIVEITTGFREFVVGVVDYLYKDTPRIIYTATDRDVEIYGHVRPLVFASEPSYLAITLSLLVFLVFVCDLAGRPMFSFLRAGAMLVVSYLVSPSLTYGFTAAVISLWLLQRMTVSGRLASAAFILPPVLVALLALGSANPLVVEIIEHSQTGSFFGRVIAPPLSAANVLASYPLFGVGVGNEDSAYPMIFAAWSRAGAFSRFPWFADSTAAGLVTNPFWWHWIYFGLVGGTGFVILIWRLLGALGINHRLPVLLSTAIFWSAGFGYVDLVSWTIFYLFAFGSRFLSPVGDAQARSEKPPVSHSVVSTHLPV